MQTKSQQRINAELEVAEMTGTPLTLVQEIAERNPMGTMDVLILGTQRYHMDHYDCQHAHPIAN